jgi:hypothetical protein
VGYTGDSTCTAPASPGKRMARANNTFHRVAVRNGAPQGRFSSRRRPPGKHGARATGECARASRRARRARVHVCTCMYILHTHAHGACAQRGKMVKNEPGPAAAGGPRPARGAVRQQRRGGDTAAGMAAARAGEARTCTDSGAHGAVHMCCSTWNVKNRIPCAAATQRRVPNTHWQGISPTQRRKSAGALICQRGAHASDDAP